MATTNHTGSQSSRQILRPAVRDPSLRARPSILRARRDAVQGPRPRQKERGLHRGRLKVQTLRRRRRQSFSRTVGRAKDVGGVFRRQI